MQTTINRSCEEFEKNDVSCTSYLKNKAGEIKEKNRDREAGRSQFCKIFL